MLADEKCHAALAAAPWCGHCKSLGPKYEKAAKRMAIKGHSKLFAKCDAIENTVAKDKYGISGFPNLKLFKHGKEMAEYPGQREVEAMVQYMEKCVRLSAPPRARPTTPPPPSRSCANSRARSVRPAQPQAARTDRRAGGRDCQVLGARAERGEL